jgi:hypothetical protein
MDESTLEEAYRRVLAESRRKGDLLEEAPGTERRRHPRVRINRDDLPAELDPWVFAIDISISGMALFADDPVEPGGTVTMALGDQFSVEAEVMRCQEEPPTAPHLPTRYRLHCRFADEEEGMRLLVAIKELESGSTA